MENSMGVGLMAAFAVSGSVVLISTQFHKRLLNNFMDKIESELGSHGKKQRKMKRVRFAEDVTQLSPISDDLYYEEDEYEDEDLGGMPVNRQILYKGIMEYRNMKDYHISTCI
ncbi:hypothetical protein LINGRAHAP2_LOCUS12935 [Linum grandiflorum]